MEFRALLRHKWIIPIAALIFVLSIGAGAWAATSTDDSSSEGTTQNSSDCREYCEPGEGMRGFRGPTGGFFGDDEARAEAREEMRDRAQDRWQSFVDSVRGEMSNVDQQELDALLEQLEQQRDSLRQASEEVRDTMQQLRDLLGKYDTDSTETSRSDTDASGMTATPAPSATPIVYQ